MKEKSNKGITLVALIITIIILLILAVVAISAVTGNGIIAHAKKARDLYRTKSEEENALLQNYLEQLNKEIKGNGSSGDDGKETGETTVKSNLNKVLSTGGNITLEDNSPSRSENNNKNRYRKYRFKLYSRRYKCNKRNSSRRWRRKTICMDTSRNNIYRRRKNRSKCKNNNIRKI